MTTTQDIHGHEVLHLVHDQPGSRAQFEQLAAKRWGADARFRTCSSSGMTLAELLDFLLARGKIVDRGGQLEVNFAEVCADGQAK